MNTALNLAAIWQTCWQLPDRRPIYEWARDGVQMPPGLTRRDFDPEGSRHFQEIFNALADDHVRQVAIRKPLRGGGTLISDIWHCWARACDPGPQLCVLQSQDMAEDHFEDRLRIMMMRSPALKSILPTGRYSIQNSEIKFADGLPLYIVGAQSLARLQTKGVRYASADECWLYKPGVIGEIEGRLGDFEKMGLSKLLLISQGSAEDDDFDRRWQEGSAEEWHVQCVHCHEYFRPKFKHGQGKDSQGLRGMRWDDIKDNHGNWKINECLKTVRYECPLCGAPMSDGARTKSEWNRTGEYRVGNPNAPRSKRSFHWPGPIDWPWTKLVELYLSARNAAHVGIVEPQIQFWQKYEAEPRSERTLLNDTPELKKVKQNGELGHEPDFIRVLACDKQAEGEYYGTCFSIQQTGDMRLLWYGRLYGGASVKAKADELTCDNVMLDSGFEAKSSTGVYALCCRYHSDVQRWISCKGSGDRFFWHQAGKGRRVMRSYSEPARGDPEAGRSGEGQAYAILVRFSSDVFNERLDKLIANGKITIAEDVDPEDFRKHLGAEYRKQKRDRFSGKVSWVWCCPSGLNHYRDAARMALLAGTMAGTLPDMDLEPV